MTTSRIISTESLKLGDVPTPESKWAKLAAFALTFDPHEMGDYGKKASDPNNISQNSLVVELRAHLYVEQRRWNHFGQEPDKVAMARLREIVTLVRKKLKDIETVR